jgi:phosphoribosylformylglycinamidine synthase
MLKDMAGSVLGIWVAHGEGKMHFPSEKIRKEVFAKQLVPIFFVDDEGWYTDKYPFNPNGSYCGATALCSPDGRHLAMMPHPERTFLMWQWPWLPATWKKMVEVSPWLKMFQNARIWCENNR